ncbi:MAG: class B sortase [Gordonibacter sp.]|uniref:class B sortase n=1 Tax=Gordonibacter sp. TaxID=1968902 RepID=UPI002FCC01B3
MSSDPRNSPNTPPPARAAQQDRDVQPKHARPAASSEKNASKKRSVIALSLLLALLLCGVAAGVGYMVWQQMELDRAAQQIKDTPEPVIEQPANDEQNNLIDNPIDFASLKLENPDIYAWIHIPQTDVNLPVLQSVENDNLYLDHNRDKEYAVEGAIYSQMANDTGFSDPVTVLYGHNLVNGTMFSTLHYFENEDFFNANETMYIYTPGHVLTYRVISAYLYDDRHILNSYDFRSPTVLQEYFNSVINPDSLLVNTRPGTELSIDDKIVQLSTCMSDTNHSNSRYIVTGVLIDDQPTR